MLCIILTSRNISKAKYHSHFVVRSKTVNFPQLSQLSPQAVFGENIKPSMTVKHWCSA